MNESYDEKHDRVSGYAMRLRESLGWLDHHLDITKGKRQTYRLVFRNRFRVFGNMTEDDAFSLDLFTRKKTLSRVINILDSFSKFEKNEKNLFVSALMTDLNWHMVDVIEPQDPRTHRISYKKRADSRFTYYMPTYDLLVIAHLVNPNLPAPVVDVNRDVFIQDC